MLQAQLRVELQRVEAGMALHDRVQKVAQNAMDHQR